MKGTVWKRQIICLCVLAVCALLVFYNRSSSNTRKLINRIPSISPISQPRKATSPPHALFIPDPEILQEMSRDELYSLQQRYMTNLQIRCPRKTVYGGVGKGWYTCDLYRGDNAQRCDAYLLTDVLSKEGEMFFDEIQVDHGCKKHVILTTDTESKLTRYLKDVLKQPKEDTNYREKYFMAVSTSTHEDFLLDWLLQNKLLTDVQQLFVTFHGIDAQSSTSAYIHHLSVLKALYEEGFRSFHYLFNPIYYYNHSMRMWTTKGRYTLYMMRALPVSPPIVIPPTADIKRMSLPKLGLLYHSYMHSSQEHCKDVVRVGQASDGGWNMCNATEYRPSQPCLVYSFGINNDWGFDDDISTNYGCEVHAFDPSMGFNDHKRSSKITFHNLGLSDKNGIMNGNWKCMNLQTIIQSLGHEGRIIDIVKMDIEGSEWPAMDSFIPSGVLKNVRQLYFEFHGSIGPTAEFRNRMINIGRLYDNGFRLFWGHPNQVQVNLGMYNATGREVTACYEEYYVNVKLKRFV
ncbi:uncharacterized protein LOC110465406 [Mizuhopecten yessoensis]|uniref:uncharacterized protein LOC110465406 n=1 Tax=Mizuhopecten yessoensis TaxID=6573 RepID=UPI000B45B9A8|nr:uncharacterized protein LOC110465406 [Mizuhopecten yessoensis]